MSPGRGGGVLGEGQQSFEEEGGLGSTGVVHAVRQQGWS